jgi:glycosyltransferase involved in cell wall biosynthesis
MNESILRPIVTSGNNIFYLIPRIKDLEVNIGIDLLSFDTNYTGGVNTFSLGLTAGIISAADANDNIILISSRENRCYFETNFSDDRIKILVIETSKSYFFVNRVLNYLAWLTRCFKLRFYYEKNFRQALMRKVDLEVDGLIAPTTLLSFYALKKPSILCIHDIQQEYHPEFFSMRDRIVRWSLYRASSWSATLIQASSSYIKECLLEKFPFLTPTKIFIAPEGVDENKFSGVKPSIPKNLKLSLSSDFIFYPAQLWPHKNHLLLVEALARFKQIHGRELNCVLTGLDAGFWTKVGDAIKLRNLSNVQYLGKVSFGELVWLYRNCKAVLALGIHESSSLPLREASVFAKPVFAANIKPNIETSNVLKVILVDSFDPSDLAAKLYSVLYDDQKLTLLGMENKKAISNFAWDKIAITYIKHLKEKILERGKA